MFYGSKDSWRRFSEMSMKLHAVGAPALQHFHAAVFLGFHLGMTPSGTPMPRPPEPSDLFLLLMAGSHHAVPTLAHFFRITSSPLCLQVNSLVWILHGGVESCSTSSGREGAQQWPRGAGACLDVQKARAGKKLKPAELRASTNWSVYRKRAKYILDRLLE